MLKRGDTYFNRNNDSNHLCNAFNNLADLVRTWLYVHKIMNALRRISMKALLHSFLVSSVLEVGGAWMAWMAWISMDMHGGQMTLIR